jgi:hypothetical protein
MTDEHSGRPGDLQFDTAVPQAGAPPAGGALSCKFCARPITGEYYDVSGRETCPTCHSQVTTLMETPRGAGPFVLASLFGLGAGIVGAIIYYAVIAITNFEIGIVAILIGYMVGYAVRKGAGGRGGRRFQVLAIVLTYVAVGLAYTPIAITAAVKGRPAAKTSQTSTPAPSTDETKTTPGAPQPSLIRVVALVVGFIVALPVLVIVGGLPSSLLSAAIIFFGMRQAWRMTGVPPLEVSGPYRIGERPAVTA